MLLYLSIALSVIANLVFVRHIKYVVASAYSLTIEQAKNKHRYQIISEFS